MKNFKSIFMVTAIVLIMSLTFVGCTSGTDNENDQQEVSISYVNWACATASTYLVKNILEIEYDYDVTLHDLEAGQMWQGLSTGDADFILAAWLPNTHSNYYSQFKDDVVNVGENYHGAMVGLVVPTYVDIDSIEELNANIDKFEGQIVGIDSGAGIMAATNNAIEEYDLDLNLLESSDAAMTAELSRAIANNEWVVVTGWAPHWKFADFDLKFLEDPKDVYGGEETINTIAREGFATDHPEIQTFLEKYYLSPEELGGLIATMEEYSNRDEAAQVWIEQNRELVDSWLN